MQNREVEALKSQLVATQNDHCVGSWFFSVHAEVVASVELSVGLAGLLFQQKIINPSYLDICHQINISHREEFKNEILNTIRDKKEFAFTTNLENFENKSVRWYGSPILNDKGVVCKIVGTCHDISSMNLIVESLLNKNDDIALMLSNIKDAIVAVDLDKTISRVNDSAKKMVSLEESQIVGKKFDEVFHLIDARLNKKELETQIELAMNLRENIQIKGDLIFLNPDGSFLTLSIDISPVIDQNGVLVGSVLLLRDISNEVKLEEQLRHSEKMRAIGQLSGGIAHDFNNLLAGVVGCANILKKKVQDNGLHSYIDDILYVSKRAASLTSQLLMFGRNDKPRVDCVDISNLVSEVINLLNYTLRDSIAIEYVKPKREFLVEGDFSQLQNTILNLALNASDAIESDGVIKFGVTAVDAKDVDLKEYFFPISCEQMVQIKVIDDGVGIPPSILSHIFEPFFTTKEKGKGTGLGLSTVYATIKNHHGSVKVESGVGKGTIFTVLLPLFGVAATSLIVPSPIQMAGKVILVVDDDTLLSDLAREALTDAGFKVYVATSGQEALDIYKEKKEEISLVLLDVLMPGMRGDEVYRKLKVANPDVKVIFASGFTDSQLNDDPEDWMKEPFIQKPYDDEELMQMISKVLS